MRPLYLSALTAMLLTMMPAHAALITYSDSASFSAATTSLTSIGFTGEAPVNGLKDFSTSTGYQISGVTFVGYVTASSYSLHINDSGFSTPYWNFGTGAVLSSPIYDRAAGAALPYIRVTFPANITAFSTDLMTVSPNALTFQVAAQGSTFSVATANRPTQTFFGITSDVPFSYVDFTVAGTSLNGSTFGLVDNVQFGQATPPVMEGATFVLMGGGLLALGVFRKRLRRLNPA